MKFKLYLFLSLIIHLLFLFFFPESNNKERLKGEKIVPIELLNNKSFNSTKGNSNQNSLNTKEKKIIDKNNKFIKTQKKSTPDKSSKSNDMKKIIAGDFKINNKQINNKLIDKKNNKKSKEKPLVQEKKLDNTKLSIPQKKGFANKAYKKDPETGSIKGKGKLKITCLLCVSPKYPKKALKKGLEGKPIVKVLILKNGRVEKAEIIISSGIDSIDNAALVAARKSEFYPIEYKTFFNIEYDLKLK